MIFYPPTTLLPSSTPPYRDLDEITSRLCDACLIVSDKKDIPYSEIEQYFDITMALVDFWFQELDGRYSQ